MHLLGRSNAAWERAACKRAATAEPPPTVYFLELPLPLAAPRYSPRANALFSSLLLATRRVQTRPGCSSLLAACKRALLQYRVQTRPASPPRANAQPLLRC